VAVSPQLHAMASETELVTTAIALARSLGWERVAHFRPARTAKGWRTPVEGDKGFPDLVLVRERVVWIEAKVRGEKPSPDQWLWLQALANTGAEVHVIQLDTKWEYLENVLKRV